ncbi:hypothetical protein QWJ07_26460 [Frankia sp. RB7]|nr:hypothetical protein [Frankia sp. RB7]
MIYRKLRTSILAASAVLVLASTAHADPLKIGSLIATDIVAGNIKAASRESGVGAQVIRGVTGISLGDIQKHGLWGGPNSFFRKPFG